MGPATSRLASRRLHRLSKPIEDLPGQASWKCHRTGHRWLLVWLYRLWPGVLASIIIVKPATVVRWHRSGFRSYWRWTSRAQPGRPRGPKEIGDLIREVSLAHPLWSAPRIHGKLLKVGIDVALSSGLTRSNRSPISGSYATLWPESSFRQAQETQGDSIGCMRWCNLAEADSTRLPKPTVQEYRYTSDHHGVPSSRRRRAPSPSAGHYSIRITETRRLSLL